MPNQKQVIAFALGVAFGIYVVPVISARVRGGG